MPSSAWNVIATNNCDVFYRFSTERTVHRYALVYSLLGFKVRDPIRLLNDENFHIPFNVLEESLYSEGKFQKLAVTPITGSLPSNSEQLLWWLSLFPINGVQSTIPRLLTDTLCILTRYRPHIIDIHQRWFNIFRIWSMYRWIRTARR